MAVMENGWSSKVFSEVPKRNDLGADGRQVVVKFWDVELIDVLSSC